MKPLFISLLIIASLFAAGCMNARTITDLSGAIDEQLALSLDAAQNGQWPAADAALQRAGALWDSHETYLRMTVTHEELHATEEILFEARQYAGQRDLENYCSSARQLRMQMEHLRTLQKINLQNIF